jgi:cbb3-type cytochrome oxidase subunit 3
MKYFFSFIVGAILCLGVSSVVLAAPDIGFGNNGMAQQIGNKSGFDTSGGSTQLSSTVGNIVRAMLSLSGTIFLALTVYGGVRWMLSRGDEAEIEKSKAIIQTAVIGLAISLSAYAITAFVVTKISDSTTSNQVGGGSPPPAQQGNSGR